MKRLLALLLVFATLTALISGCASEKDSTYVLPSVRPSDLFIRI